MTKKTFLFPWVATFLLFLIAGLFSNSGPVIAQEPSNQPINLLPDPLVANLSDKLENEALVAEIGDQISYITKLSVNPEPIGNTKIEPVSDIVYQLDVDSSITLSGIFDTTPIAYDDVYSLPSATDFTINAAEGLLASSSASAAVLKETLAADQDFDLSPLVSVIPETVSTDFATIAIRADGSFDYNLSDPAEGGPPADYFSYTITDEEGNASIGSVILQFERQRIFFVDSEADSAGNGLLESPFQQLADAVLAADSACDVIFLLSSATPYDVDHVELQACQKLIGQDYAPYTFAQISGFDLETIPEPTAENRPTIRCAQTVDYLTGIDPTQMFPTTDQGCIELAQDNVVAGINVDNANSIQKAIAGENFSTFWSFNTTALNSDGFSFSCNDSSEHTVKLTDSIRVQNYGFIGIDLAAFPTAPLTPNQCILNGMLTDISVVDAAVGAHEAVYAISQSESSLSLKIDQFEATEIAHSVIRATANDSSTISLEVSNAHMTAFDMVGVYVESYVFWPLAERERGLFASVTDSVLIPNKNGRGILANSQGNVASDLQFSDNEIGKLGVQSDGIVVYGNNDGAVNAIINDNLLLSQGAPEPNLPVNQTHAPHMPIYFESNMPNSVGCLTIAGNQAPAGFNAIYRLETASLGVKAGTDGEVRIEGWNGQNGGSGAAQFIKTANSDLVGGTEFTVNQRGELTGGQCAEIPIPTLRSEFDLALSNQIEVVADLADPIIQIPVLPVGKTVTIQMTAVVNESAEGLDRTSAQGIYMVEGLNQVYKTSDPDPSSGFEDSSGRTVTPLLLDGVIPNLIVSDLVINENIGVATLVVELSEASALDIEIDYTTINGTAESGLDYAQTTGQLMFPAGSTSQSIQLSIIDDAIEEVDEQFVVEFLAAGTVPVTISDTQSQITILANDFPVVVVPTLIVTDVTVSEGAGPAVATIELSDASNQEIVISYSTLAGTALAGSDFAPSSGKAVFAPGQTTAAIDIEIIDDSIVEDEEQFILNVSPAIGSNVSVPDSSVTITIEDDDTLPPPNLSAADVTINEGAGTATVQIILDVVASQDLVIDFQTFSELAVSPSDFTDVNGTLSIVAGSQTASFNISIIDDADAELNEYFFVRLTTADSALVTIKNPELVITIVDNDDILLFAGNENGQAVRVVEDEGVAFVDVTLNRPAASEVQVDVSTQNLLAMAPSDYTAVPVTTLVFAPGEVRKTVEIVIVDDDITSEGLERLRLRIENPVNAEIHGNAFAEVVIVDNDSPLPFLYFEFADYGIYEDMDNNPATPSELDVVVKLSNPATSAITVTVKSIDNETSASPPGDYTSINQIITIPAGQREATFTVQVNEDNLPERQEAFVLRFFDTSSGVIVDPTQNSTTVTIADGTPPVIRLNQTLVTESQTGNLQSTIELVLSGNVVLPVRFGVQTFRESSLERNLGMSDLRLFRLNPGTARFRLNVSTLTSLDVADSLVSDPLSQSELIIIDGAIGESFTNKVELASRPHKIFIPMAGS